MKLRGKLRRSPQGEPSPTVPNSERIIDPFDKSIGSSISLTEFKDYVNYGTNRVLDNFKSAKEAEWRINQFKDDQKPGMRDWAKYAFIIIMIALAGFILFIGVNQFANYGNAMEQNAGLKAALAACDTKLGFALNGTASLASGTIVGSAVIGPGTTLTS